MQKLIVFNQITLDGYFCGPSGDISWLHRPETNDPEWKAFVAENAKGGGTLIFGRITYELMASHWPTPQAIKSDPIVAERMNNLPKVVFSKTLKNASWNNTTIVNGDLVAEIQKLKQQNGKGLAIFGSGTLVSQLAQESLIDEYQIVVYPLVLGKGRTMFDGVKDKITLNRTKTRAFANGNILLCYSPV